MLNTRLYGSSKGYEHEKGRGVEQALLGKEDQRTDPLRLDNKTVQLIWLITAILRLV